MYQVLPNIWLAELESRFRKEASRTLVYAFTLAVLNGCSSGALYRVGSEPPPSDNAHPDAASYGADSFSFGKKMRIRPANNQIFFSKHCDLTSDRGFISMTAYDCTY